MKLPIYQELQGRRHILIVHLFSGRRRWDDVHCHLDAWARSRNYEITILSMDTAISITYGNLAIEAASWQRLVECYERGWVSATLAGTPCETFSEARFQDAGDSGGSGADEGPRRMPRPLRSYERLLGLPALSRREVEQLHAGTNFFLQGLVLLGYQVVKGGLYVSEHPAPPRDDRRPSIWTSPWMQLMRAHPDINLHIIPQWPFGATVPKPTGLLALRLPKFRYSLFKHADREACRPKEVAISRNADGSFRTSKHKEYPPRSCAGLAQSFTDQFDFCIRTGHTSCATHTEECVELTRWLREAKQACQEIRESAGWLPDYQPG